MNRTDHTMGKLLHFRRPGELDYASWLEKLKSGSSLERIEALESPPDLSPATIVPPVIEALSDPDEMVRLSAAETLGFYPAPPTAPALRAFIDKEEGDSLALAYAFSSLGLVADTDDDVQYLLAARERTTNPTAHIHLMMGIYYAGRRMARETLIPFLQHEQSEVRSLASEALVSLLSTPDDVPEIANAIEQQIDEETAPETREALENALRIMEDEGYL